MLTSNGKGAIAEVEIAAAATRLGIPVFAPLTQHGRYDLVFELRSGLVRVQCKWGSLDEAAAVVRAKLECSSCSPSGYVRRNYAEDELDFVAVYCGDLDRSYLLPIALIAGRGGVYLRLTPPRNAQRACINLASDYEFAGAVAQLEERSAGSRKVRGSSPLSSTSKPDPDRVPVIGSNEFRNRFGYHIERAAAGDEILVTRHGRPFVKLGPAPAPQARLALTPPIAPAPLPTNSPAGSTRGPPA